MSNDLPHTNDHVEATAFDTDAPARGPAAPEPASRQELEDAHVGVSEDADIPVEELAAGAKVDKDTDVKGEDDADLTEHKSVIESSEPEAVTGAASFESQLEDNVLSFVPSTTPVSVLPSTTPATLPGAFNPSNSLILVGGSLALAALLALIAVLFARRRASARGTDVLLVGPSDSGKTALFARLVYGRAVRTHASMQPNAASLPGSRTKLRLVDLPGHARLRAQGLQDHLPRARGVLFVVDASTVARSGAAVAEHLHEVLHALAALPAARPPPLAVLATKADLAGGAVTASTRVRTVLERELDKRRAARVDVDADADALGGLETVAAPGSPFRLSEWEGGEIRVFAGSSAGDAEKGSEKDTLAEVREWIDTLE